MKRQQIIIALLLIVIIGIAAAFSSTDKRAIKRSFFNTDPNGVVYIIVDKSDYELKVYDDEGWYATYPVVFGSKDLSDKMMEGDRRTPEGTFKIVSKKPHQKWHKMLMLDYPNQESYQKFNQRKSNRQIPASARIGGGIAIHGTWPNDNIVVDGFTNWTNGCVSLKNEDLDELEAFLPIGTKVIIRR